MQITSGFGWDDARKCVVVDSPEILDEYLKIELQVVWLSRRPTADVIENQNIDNEEGESFPSSNSNPQNSANSSNPNLKDSA
uniref:Myb/SANT-like domain-containing protein n=1 Tax=Lactuca sativa TaxID=4236 RepID=A0A9R1X2U9_LACSA|nr:hypothetical protein LSAT_V11C700374560 [Lactuca sativa]